MIAVIDYGMGNLRSVEKALTRLGAPARVTDRAEDVNRADRLVVPGVGAFDHAVRELRARGLFEVIQNAIRSGKPYLGLCLGLQLLFESSDEGRERGFGILSGRVRRFDGRLKVPHMGWNRVTFADGCPYGRRLPAESFFYFVHSYYALPEEAAVWAGRTTYGTEFASAILKDNVFATQFHPEKSQANGLALLENYLEVG